MSKKKKDSIDKTLVEKILDKKKVAYHQMQLPWEEKGDVANLKIDALDIDPNKIYKTIALMGNKTGPVIAVVPINRTVSYKKLAKVSNNKKVGMIPLKDLVNTTGYEHGANTPVGIHETHPKFPIFIDEIAKVDETIIISSGEIGRSIAIKAFDLQKVVGSIFADISELKEE